MRQINKSPIERGRDLIERERERERERVSKSDTDMRQIED